MSQKRRQRKGCIEPIKDKKIQKEKKKEAKRFVVKVVSMKCYEQQLQGKGEEFCAIVTIARIEQVIPSLARSFIEDRERIYPLLSVLLEFMTVVIDD